MHARIVPIALAYEESSTRPSYNAERQAFDALSDRLLHTPKHCAGRAAPILLVVSQPKI